MVSKGLVLGLASMVIVLIAFAIAMNNVPDPSKIEFSAKGFVIETNVGSIPIGENIENTKESEKYIGDTIKDNTIISNTFGFVISAPNGTWKINYEPKLIQASEFWPEHWEVAYMEKEQRQFWDSVSIEIRNDHILDLDETISSHKTWLSNLDARISDMTHYKNEEENTAVFTYNKYFCYFDDCWNILTIDVLRIHEDRLYIISGAEFGFYEKESKTVSSEIYEILNSFKII